MSDNLDIRARLTADDQASPTIKRLLDQVTRLEAKLKSGFGKNKIATSIIDDKTLARLQKGGKEIDGLTQKYMRWARVERDEGRMSAARWTKMTNDINDHAKAYMKATGKKQQALGQMLTKEVKYAQAYKAVWNASHRDRIRMQERLHDNLSRIESAHMQRQLRDERSHQNAILQSRRNFARNLRSLSSQARNVGGGAAGLYALAAGGAGYAMGRSAIRSATDMDRAEANARINMDQSIVGARGLRDNWALPRSVALGQQPSRLMQTAVEAAKAGVPEQISAGTAEMVTQLAKTFGIEVDQAMDGIGYAIAQEMGAGRMDGSNIKGVRRLGNITAYLAAKTAARPDQMLGFLRTGLGGGAMLGMSQESTLAFGAAGIQAGAQGQQTARFLGHLGETLATLNMEAKTIQRKGGIRSPQDRLFMGLPAKLGYGGYGDIEQRIRKSPDTAVFDLIKSFGKIKDPLDREQAMTSMFGQEFSRFLANMISSPEMLDRTMKLAKEAAGQTEQNDFLTSSWGEFTKSLEFFIDRVKAVWSVLKSELGDVLKPFIEQFSDWVTDWYTTIKTSGIKERFKGFLDGLTEGFLGKPGTFRDLLDKVFGKPGEGNGGNVESFFKFAKGLAEGIKSTASTFASVFKTIISAFGSNSSDPEVMGKFVGQLGSLVIALTALSPVINVLGLVVSGLLMLGSALKLLEGAGALKLIGKLGARFGLGAAAAGAGPIAGMALLGDGRGTNSLKDINSLTEALKKAREEKAKSKAAGHGDGNADPFFQPTSYRSSVDGLSDQLGRFGGKFELAALRTTGLGGSGSGGLGSVLVGGGSGGGLRLGGGGSGTPMALLSSTPGAKLPNFGMGSSGIIRRGNVPSFSGGGGSADANVGAGLSGNSFLAARRSRFADEIKNDPTLAMHLAAMQATEGASKGGTIESLMNRADMQGKSLRQMLGYSADGRINPKSFYGPIRRGELGPAIARLQRNPKEFAKYDAFTQRALAGGHVIGGYTDQGLATDPNGSARTGIKGFKISPKDGNEFTDWVGPGSAWGRGRAGAQNFRKFYEQGITGSVPSPADATRNVPAAVRPNGDASMGGGSRGNVAIHINGSSHDPEALATLVQRRVDESMNWRIHDSESEYT